MVFCKVWKSAESESSKPEIIIEKREGKLEVEKGLDNLRESLVALEQNEKTCTVWKFHNFSITQILREMNFGYSTSAKSVIFTHLEALNFNIYFFVGWNLPNYQNSEPLKLQKWQFLHF